MSGRSEPPSGFGTPLFEGHEPNLDIIAVHGIGAHRDYTWSAGGSSWLSKEDMLPSCFPRARIMAYGYASNWLGQLSMATCLVDVADRLLSLLQDLRKDCPHRQLVFIAHCFGGIVIEKALLQALARGTPHRGSSSAGLAQTVAIIAAALNYAHKSPLLETLGGDSQLLDDTVRNFAIQANRLKLNIHCFYEERETNIAPLARSLTSSFIPVSRRTTLVERESACLQGHGCTALTLDHFQLNKFTDPHDANYILVRHAVGEMLLAASDISNLKFTKCLEELYVVDPGYQLQNIQNTWGKRYQGPKRFSTSDSRFLDWQNDEHGRVLWITGSTPVEQSVVVSGIVSEIMNDSSSKLAFCFCENGRDIDSISVFRILIWMLVKTHRKLGRYLKPFGTPGRSLTIDVLDSGLLSLMLSNMITDPDISTIYFVIDQIHTCGDKMSLFLDFVSLSASEKTSKIKWIMSGSQQFQTFWLDAIWVTKVNLGQSTQPLAATPFKPPTIQGLVSNTPVYYRIRGLGSSWSLSQSRQIISALFSADEQHIFDFCSSLVPSCDDNSASQTLLMKTDYPPNFLAYLEGDLSANCFVNTPGGRLCFDRHFQGFTQLYANPLDEPINADVVAIPDLNGHAYSSWRPEGSTGGIWIQEFFQQDLPQCRVLAYGYIPKFAVEGIQSMNKYCEELLQWLHCVRKTAEEAHRPLIFVCHGFGCLLAAKILLKAVNSQESGATGGPLADSITGLILFAASEKGDILDEIQRMLESEAESPSLDHVIDMVKDILEELSEELIDFKTYLEDSKILHFAPSRPPKRVRLDMKPWSQRRELFDLDPPMIIDTAQKKETVPGFKSNIHQLGTKSLPAYKRMLGFVRSHEKEQAKIRSLEWLEAGKVRPKGITIMHDPPAPIADVVLIPGLQGDPWEAWSCTPRSSTRSTTLGRFWPQVYLPTTLNNTRVMTWGSEAELPNQLESFLDQAAGLLRDLSALRPMGRSLVFVAHAEGGLLLKKALLLSERGVSEIEKDLIRWTSAVVFLVSRRCLGRDRISFDVQSQQALGSQNQEFARGESSSDVESFSLLQETYGIQTSYFLESSVRDYRDSVRSHVRALPSIQSATSTTFATPLKSKPVVERILSNAQGFCRFESCLDNGYVRLSKVLRSYTDSIKAMGLQSRAVLLSSLYFTEIDHREGSIENTAVNTSAWLFGHRNFVDWSKWAFGPGSPGLLWIKGKPGSGKSTLMKKILRHLKSTGLPSSVSVASFFFTARSNVKLQNSALGLFRTLLYVLISQDKALLHAFIPVYRAKCAKSAAQEFEWEWKEEELRAFFESAYAGNYPGVKNAVVMVDALDEVRSETYDEAYRVAQDLVHFFRNLAAKGKLKVCLSSRHFPNIQVPDCDQIVVEDFNDDDIAKFVNDKFPNLTSSGKLNSLGKKVAEKAKGVFIWVTVVVGRLKAGLDNEMTESGLERILDDLPSELERLFEGMIDSNMNRTEVQNAEEIFQWILLSERPLEKDELRHILTIKRHPDDEETPTTLINHWYESHNCLDSNPERFLMQLRLYTRGLAEIVLRRESSEDLCESSGSSLKVSSILESISMQIENSYESSGHRKGSSGVILPNPSSLKNISTRPKSFEEPPEHLGDSSRITLPKSLTQRPEVARQCGNTLLENEVMKEESEAPKELLNAMRKGSEARKKDREVRKKDLEARKKDHKARKEEREARRKEREARRKERKEQTSANNEFANCGTTAPWIGEMEPWRSVPSAGEKRQENVGWSAVQFIHESVREFFLFGSGFSLLRPDGLKRSLSERHEILSEYCMACIMQSTTYASTASASDQSQMPKSHPFLQYALLGVFYHARQVESSQKVAEKVLHQLADTQQTFWRAWRFAASFYNEKRNEGWETGCSPLHLLARHRMFLSISFMLKSGFDVNVQDSHGDSALHYAAREGIADMVEFLVSNQTGIESQSRHSKQNAMSSVMAEGLIGCAANPNLQNQAGETALHFAVRSKDVAITQLLLQHGAQTNIKNSRGENALHIALKTPESSMVQTLIGYGVDIHAQNNARESVVHIAAKMSNVSILESLVQQGGDINSKDGRGMTPIHHRIAHRYGIRPLVRLGADVRAKSFVGKTVLHMFMEDGSCDHDSFNALGRTQDLLFITDTQAMTALHYAAHKSSAAWVQRLLLILPEQDTILELLSKRNRLGQTAIHFAAQRDNLDALRVLLEAGADLEIRDRDGMTPVDYAADKIAREPSLERQLYLKRYRRMLRRMNGRMVSVFTK